VQLWYESGGPLAKVEGRCRVSRLGAKSSRRERRKHPAEWGVGMSPSLALKVTKR